MALEVGIDGSHRHLGNCWALLISSNFPSSYIAKVFDNFDESSVCRSNVLVSSWKDPPWQSLWSALERTSCHAFNFFLNCKGLTIHTFSDV